MYLVVKKNKTYDVIGVKCGGCVKKLTTALHNYDKDAVVSVDIAEQQLSLQSQLSNETVEKVLAELGYLPDTDKPLHTDSPSVATDKPTQIVSDNIITDSYTLSIGGMTCAACVGSVEKALQQVAGVTDVSVNFATKQADIIGVTDTDSLLQAIKNAGYQATLINTIDTADEQRQQQENNDYQHKRRQSSVAIGIGAILMSLFRRNVVFRQTLLSRGVGITETSQQ